MLNLKKLGNLFPKRSLNSKTAFLRGLQNIYDEEDLKKHPVFKKATKFELTEGKSQKFGFVHFENASDKTEAIALATEFLGNSREPETMIPFGSECRKLQNTNHFTKLSRHQMHDTIEIDGLIDELEDEKIEEMMKAEFEGVSEVFVYKNADFGRKFDKEADRSEGKFARVSFDSVKLASAAGKKIGGYQMSKEQDAEEQVLDAEKSLIYFSEGVPLTGGSSVNHRGFGGNFKTAQLVGRAGQHRNKDSKTKNRY